LHKRPFDVVEYLPEIELITDEDLRTKVMAIWNRVYESSTFTDPEELPVAPGKPYSHFTHNRSVANHALAIAENLEKFHGITVDRNVLLTAALLQDSGKFAEFEYRDGKVELSAMGRDFQHGFWAAHEALIEGLPHEIVATVFRHTFDAQKFPETLITKIIFYCDQIDMSALGYDSWDKVAFAFRTSPYASKA
jgi:hypothetical protein